MWVARGEEVSKFCVPNVWTTPYKNYNSWSPAWILPGFATSQSAGVRLRKTALDFKTAQHFCYGWWCTILSDCRRTDWHWGPRSLVASHAYLTTYWTQCRYLRLKKVNGFHGKVNKNVFAFYFSNFKFLAAFFIATFSNFYQILTFTLKQEVFKKK